MLTVVVIVNDVCNVVSDTSSTLNFTLVDDHDCKLCLSYVTIYQFAFELVALLVEDQIQLQL